MTTYTATAGANGDFTVPFPSNYTSGQKIIVTAEKDGETKSIELFAPSETVGATMSFSGTMDNFPLNVGIVTVNMTGKLQDYAFGGVGSNIAYAGTLGRAATDFVLNGCTRIGRNAFEYTRVSINQILASPTLTTIDQYAFAYCQRSQVVSIPAGKTWGNYVFREALITEATLENGFTIIQIGMFYQCSTLTKAIVPATITEFKDLAFSGCFGLKDLTVFATTPPTIASNSLQGIASTCIIKVPSASLAAYQAATYWSVHASKMVGI